MEYMNSQYTEKNCMLYIEVMVAWNGKWYNVTYYGIEWYNLNCYGTKWYNLICYCTDIWYNLTVIVLLMVQLDYWWRSTTCRSMVTL